MDREFWIRHWESTLLEKRPGFCAKIERALLRFSSWFYGLAVSARNSGFELHIFSARKVKVPVISVGNISLGGTGKTTLVMWCAQKLLENRRHPAILSRGYLRKNRGSETVMISSSDNPADSALAGDEPYLMNQKLKEVPVVVGSDRAKSARLAIDKLSPDCLLMDDGFQHRWLQRDFDIVCLNEKMFLAPDLFPRGFLREKWDAMRRADFVVMKADSELTADTWSKNLPIKSPTAAFRYKVVGIRRNGGEEILPPDWLAEKRMMACSGIADAGSFELLLKKHGARVTLLRTFSDHHAYTPGELMHLEQEAEQNKCVIVTTEKDLARMPKDFSAFAVCVEMEWFYGEDELAKLILKVVH